MWDNLSGKDLSDSPSADNQSFHDGKLIHPYPGRSQGRDGSGNALAWALGSVPLPLPWPLAFDCVLLLAFAFDFGCALKMPRNP